MAIYLNKNMIGINSYTEIINSASTGSGSISLQSLDVNQQGTYRSNTNSAYSSVNVGPNAQLVKDYTADYKVVADKSITIPAYSTSNKALQAAVNLTPTVTLDYSNYDYYVVQRLLIVPEYNIETTGKGKVEYDFTVSLMRIMDIDANTFKSIDKQTSYASRYIPIIQQNYYCSMYWSSATAIAPYNTSTYGIIIVPTAPSVTAAGVATFRTPTINMRGHATYFTQTYFDALTDIRVQYIIECYQVPKGSSVVDGWKTPIQTNRILNCIYNNNCKLT